MERPDATAILRELGLGPQLVVYLGGAPGAGKTHRLLMEGLEQQRAGRRVAIGWIETKGRPGLDELAARLPRIAPREYDGRLDFDLGAALASDFETIVLDELAHTNPPGAPSVARWGDALALRAADFSVLGAFNVQHLASVAPVAERIVERPIREIVPTSFLRAADVVVALDVSPEVLDARLRLGRIVHPNDVDRALAGSAKPQRLELLRELLLRTVDELTVPTIAPARVSTALAIVTPGFDPERYLRRVTAFAEGLDLIVETTAVGAVDVAAYAEATLDAGVSAVPLPAGLERGRLGAVSATLVVVPATAAIVVPLLARPVDRDLYVADPERAPVRGTFGEQLVREPAWPGGRAPGRGELTIYLGATAGCGKTYAMLDRAEQLRESGVDVVVAFVETHGRLETAAKLAGLETIARTRAGEPDIEAVLARRPRVALVDELAHSNAPGSAYRKRYDDVFALLRGGISVITTLNVQHLAGLGDVVERLTGTRVRETLPDAILERADELIFIDVAPEVLRARLREGKIYPAERIESALENFFRVENLRALRELAVREIRHARASERRMRPFDRIVLGIAARERDLALVPRAGRMAVRLGAELRVVHVGRASAEPALLAEFARAARAQRAAFLYDRADDAAIRLAAIAQPGDALAVESPRSARSLFGRRSFANRLVRAGARELIVLAPALASVAPPA